MTETLEQFLHRYGRPDATTPVIEVGEHVDAWPIVVVRFCGHTAAIQCCGVTATDPADDPHLSLIVHAFHHGQPARSGVYGTENGTRYTGFADNAPGTSHGWPAVAGLTVLIGAQDVPPTPVYTVVGVWEDDEPVPVGVIVGQHQVSDGDTAHFEQGLWATSVTAPDPTAAQHAAVAEMRCQSMNPIAERRSR